MTELTIELPDTLAEQLDSYLQANPDENLVGLIQEVLERKLAPKDSSKLLSLAGIVADAPRGAAEHAEDFDD
ncbi:MAG: hypothetical protein AAF268_08980 [Cyanobacteria bacterium P01_A01_bin.3]